MRRVAIAIPTEWHVAPVRLIDDDQFSAPTQHPGMAFGIIPDSAIGCADCFTIPRGQLMNGLVDALGRALSHCVTQL